VERNRPRRSGTVYSLIGDFRMFADMLPPRAILN